MNEWECRERKGLRVNVILEKAKGDEWMGFWRRERATSGWEC